MSTERLELLQILAGCAKELADFLPAAYYSELIPDETIREKMRIIGELLVEGSENGGEI